MSQILSTGVSPTLHQFWMTIKAVVQTWWMTWQQTCVTSVFLYTDAYTQERSRQITVLYFSPECEHTLQLASKTWGYIISSHVVYSEATVCVSVCSILLYVRITHAQTTSTARFSPDCMTLSLSCMCLHGIFFYIIFEVTLFLTLLHIVDMFWSTYIWHAFLFSLNKCSCSCCCLRVLTTTW